MQTGMRQRHLARILVLAFVATSVPSWPCATDEQVADSHRCCATAAQRLKCCAGSAGQLTAAGTCRSPNEGAARVTALRAAGGTSSAPGPIVHTNDPPLRPASGTRRSVPTDSPRHIVLRI